MRKPLVAGNWKMNTDSQSAAELVSGLVASVNDGETAEVLVCPPFVYLNEISGLVRDSSVQLGAQNMYHEPSGAFTGEISASMLQDVGCQYVILGHSERRHVLGESDGDVNRKAISAISAGLTPIVCVGEKLEEREAGKTLDVVQSQFEGSLKGIGDADAVKIVIAYEPVWAIGTGKVATPAQAQEVHADLRNLLEKHYNREIADRVRILYGGSVKPDNAGELMSQPDIDGALVGGASLKAADFTAIIQASAAQV